MTPRRVGCTILILAACALLSGSERLSVAADGPSLGLNIPDAHPRLWWNAERIALGKTWLKRNDFTARPDDGLGLATRCVLTGDKGDCRAAVEYAMNAVCKNAACNSADPNVGVAADDARWEGETVILIYDWCHDYFSPEQRDTLVARWNTYLTNIRAHAWGGPAMVQSNYNWGYMRNDIEWGIATWNENPQAEASLRYGLVNRWQANITPHFATGGRGGIFQEGSAYGSAIGEYSTVPFGTASLLGRDLYRETNFFREAVMYVIYATLPKPTVNKNNGQSFYEIFPFADDERFYDGGMIARANYGTFMQAMADYWRDAPIGEYARRWLTMVKPAMAPYVSAVDRGGRERDFSTLPLDYFAPGARFVYARNRWGADATVLNLQLGVTDDEGHRHNDVGSWQIWRNGRWLSRETTGYANDIAGYDGKSVDTNNAVGHNSLLVQGRGPAPSRQDGPAVVSRLDSEVEFTYAAVDLTDSYHASHPVLDNPAASHVEREFLFVRPLEALVIFDRVETSGASAPVTFLAHFETKPTFAAGQTVSAVNGGEELRLTTLVPANPTYLPVVEEGGRAGQYRVQIETNGAKQAYMLNVLQSKGAGDAPLTAAVSDTGEAYAVTLTHPTKGATTIILNKGRTAAGGSIDVGGQSYVLTDRVEAITVTDSGPVWGGSF